jgi:hypothetical protein
LTSKHEALEVTVDPVSDDRGLFGIDETESAGPLSRRVSIRVRAADTQPAPLEKIARRRTTHCPACDAIERQIPAAIEISTT